MLTPGTAESPSFFRGIAAVTAGGGDFLCAGSSSGEIALLACNNGCFGHPVVLKEQGAPAPAPAPSPAPAALVLSPSTSPRAEPLANPPALHPPPTRHVHLRPRRVTVPREPRRVPNGERRLLLRAAAAHGGTGRLVWRLRQLRRRPRACKAPPWQCRPLLLPQPPGAQQAPGPGCSTHSGGAPPPPRAPVAGTWGATVGACRCRSPRASRHPGDANALCTALRIRKQWLLSAYCTGRAGLDRVPRPSLQPFAASHRCRDPPACSGPLLGLRGAPSPLGWRCEVAGGLLVLPRSRRFHRL